MFSEWKLSDHSDLEGQFYYKTEVQIYLRTVSKPTQYQCLVIERQSFISVNIGLRNGEKCLKLLRDFNEIFLI